jgi:hypothetical protein
MTDESLPPEGKELDTIPQCEDNPRGTPPTEPETMARDEDGLTTLDLGVVGAEGFV